MWLRRYREQPSEEDPFVAPVEAILGAVTDPYEPVALPPEDRPHADYALWVCACVTTGDAPIWLIHSTRTDGLSWCRVPGRVEMDDLIRPRLRAGGHTDPHAVLAWLQGEHPRPAGDVDGEDAVFRELRRLTQHH